jgi:arsenate reductase (thioredoxin)
MFEKLQNTISEISKITISDERKKVLQPLVEYIKLKKEKGEPIRLNFICTHNSRRSHLAQVWAQTLAFYFNIPNVQCYSGGTEATAMFPKVLDTLALQGFECINLTNTKNAIHALKFDLNEPPIIGFSKVFDDAFNPSQQFAAILTCNSADEACPYIAGAEIRISVKYDDPKAFDGTELMEEKYLERSREIASEMMLVFSSL